ncbi:NRDE family protein [Psychrobacter submarinus]|uniref:NRDE family protein n=1 Tax=Psychrobacter submarinus TaxID=154108 RepID=UPI00191A945F|nr:NRDE family protein [Psychrobacter submarinus]
MCIVAIAWQLFDELPLVLLSNRDEFLARPTEQLHQWPDQPIYAGRDSQSGGTWLGIHQQERQQQSQQQNQQSTEDNQSPLYQQNGHWAAVLNFRDGVQARADERSRGELVTSFLTSTLSPMAFARQIKLRDYAGFNLIIGDSQQAAIVNNRGHAPTALHAGLHVFSNGQPDEGWFKTEKLRGRLRQEVLPLIAEDSSLAYWQAAALNVMSDSTSAPEEALPKTGVPKAIEQALSSVYIDAVALSNTDTPMPSYGTRTQSILTLRGEDKSEVKAQLISHETDNVKC